MARNLVDKITKEFYKAKLESIANNILNRADDILEDWDKGVANIHLEADINYGSVPTIKVTKEYNPKEVK